MQRQTLKSKIHRATVTDNNPDYVGSIALDRELMAQADLLVIDESDKVIVGSFAACDERGLESYSPAVGHVDEENQSARVDPEPPTRDHTNSP